MTKAEEVMDSFREPRPAVVIGLGIETKTHVTLLLDCGHAAIEPMILSSWSTRRLYTGKTVDCRECAP